MSGRLYICATPIGNLGDVTDRLRTVLADVDLIYAEDTRRTGNLTSALGIDTPLRSYFAGNEITRSRELKHRLEAGDSIALVTDAGTPAVSDPGYSAVTAALDAKADITVLPGPSAVTAALAVSGFPTERFVFEGFLPRRGGARQRRLQGIADEERTVVLFCATGRVAGDLADLAEAAGPDRSVLVARELTKLHEELWRGTLAGAAKHWAETTPRGEFTVVIAGAPEMQPTLDRAIDEVERRMQAGESMADAVKTTAGAHGIRRRRLYEAVLKTVQHHE